MRKITQNAVNAFYQNTPFDTGNMMVEVRGKLSTLYLHEKDRKSVV